MKLNVGKIQEERSVMPTTGSNLKIAVRDSENQPICIINASTPPPSPVLFQRLRLSNARIAIAFDALKQLIDSPQCLLVYALPRKVFIPRAIMPKLFHGASSSGAGDLRTCRRRSVHGHGNFALPPCHECGLSIRQETARARAEPAECETEWPVRPTIDE